MVDVLFNYFTKKVKQYGQYLPHSVNVRIQCKILRQNMSGYFGITINKEKDRKRIYPKLLKLNSSFTVLSASSSNINFCHIEPLMYNEAGVQKCTSNTLTI